MWLVQSMCRWGLWLWVLVYEVSLATLSSSSGRFLWRIKGHHRSLNTEMLTSTTWSLTLLWRTENAWIPGEICMRMGYLKAVEILSFWFAPWREMTEWRNGKTDDFLHWKRHDIQDSASVEKALLGLAFYKPHLISFLVKEMGPNVKRLKV